ncbi:Centrosomal protein of 44 kDa [Thoreauomyces humboldtii]|nr:Centrosomal protein of 44 kDa [Thoreauomyces humboldtii]
MSSTGDLSNNLAKIQADLRHIRYNGPLDVYAASKGDPAAFLPIIHFILLDYSHVLAKHFAGRGFELYGKKDTRFMETVYRLLRDEFDYKPQLTKEQFFHMGFAERKLIFVGDLIRRAKTLHGNLGRHRSGGTAPVDSGRERLGGSSWSPPREERATRPVRAAPEPRRSLARDGAFDQQIRVLPNNVAIVEGHQSPEYEQAFRVSQAAAAVRSPTGSPRRSGKSSTIQSSLPPFGDPNASVHHEYREPKRANSLKTMNIESEPSVTVAWGPETTGSGLAPPALKHYSQNQYAGSNQATLRPEPNHLARQRNPTEGSTIYEPAPAPAPAPPPQEYPSVDMSFMSQPSMLKATPIPRSGPNDTFVSEDNSTQPSMLKATPIPRSGPNDTFVSEDSSTHFQEAEEVNPKEDWINVQNESGENTPRPSSPQHPANSHAQRDSPAQTSRLSPQQRSASFPVSGNSPARNLPQPSQFQSRTWLAPTAPPASGSQSGSQHPQQQSEQRPIDALQPVFDNFMRLFAAKEEEIAELCNRIVKLEGQQAVIAELTLRLASLEATFAHRDPHALACDSNQVPKGLPQKSQSFQPEPPSHGARQYRASVQSGNSPSRAQQHEDMPAHEDGSNGVASRLPQLPQDTQKIHDATMRSFRASVSTSQPSVFNTAYKSVPPSTHQQTSADLMRSIQERFSLTSQLLKGGAKIVGSTRIGAA